MAVLVSKKKLEERHKAYVFLSEESDYREKVLTYLSRRLGSKVTMNAISEELKLSYGHLHSTSYKLQSEGVIKMERVGNYKLLSVNWDSMLAIAELARVHVKIAQEVLGRSKKLGKLQDLIEELGKYKDILSVVLFGSQARLEARKTSDIDLLVIVNERGPARRSVVEEIKSEIRAFEVKEFLKIQPFVVDFAMFKRMLQGREEMNVGKEALKEGVILYGYENYWKSVGDAIG